jgi:hypothetical protein
MGMEATQPVVPGFEDMERKIGEAQVVYHTLTTLVVVPKSIPERTELPGLSIMEIPHRGLTLTRWRPTDEERAALARGEDVFLWTWTFDDPFQPVALTVGEPPLERAEPQAIEPEFLQVSEGLS